MTHPARVPDRHEGDNDAPRRSDDQTDRPQPGGDADRRSLGMRFWPPNWADHLVDAKTAHPRSTTTCSCELQTDEREASGRTSPPDRSRNRSTARSHVTGLKRLLEPAGRAADAGPDQRRDVGGASRPRSRARLTASARLCTPSFAYTLRMWVLIVFSDTNSSDAISGARRLVGR